MYNVNTQAYLIITNYKFNSFLYLGVFNYNGK